MQALLELLDDPATSPAAAPSLGSILIQVKKAIKAIETPEETGEE
ncbi:hypothetical protein [Gimesia panareensis]|nr:hypothetical protein [Gimesia panareensis]